MQKTSATIGEKRLLRSFRLLPRSIACLEELLELYRLIGDNTITRTRIVELLIFQEVRRVSKDKNIEHIKRLAQEREEAAKEKQEKANE